MRSTKRNTIGLAIAALVSGLVLQATPAVAKDTDIIRRGSCSGAANWKLKLSPENGRIEVEFEVDQNRNGQVWRVVMKDNGVRFFKGLRTTKAPSGSFEARALTNNRAGTDRIVARAVHLNSGQVCRGVATF